MPTLHANAAAIAASADGRWLVWDEDGRLVLFDLAKRTQVAEIAHGLERPFELAVTPTTLFAMQARSGSTLVRRYDLPELSAGVEARLKGESRFGGLCGSFAMLLGSNEPLTVVDLSELRSVALPARGPIQVVAELSAETMLVGARGKLDVWNLDERRPTHRLALPLANDVAFAGVISGGKLLWLASTGPRGAIALLRLSDGKLLAPSAAGGTIKAIAGDPETTMVVAAIQPEGGSAVQLVVLDLVAQTNRPLSFDRVISAFCLAGDAVAIQSERAQPVLIAIASATGGGAKPLSGPDADLPLPAIGELVPVDGIVNSGEPAPNDLSERLDHWRSQVKAAVVAAPPKPRSPLEALADEPRSRSRAELYAWGLSARMRTTTTPPPPPQGWRLNDLASRFELDMRSKTLLALLYAGWLDGEGKSGLPVGVVARALGNDEDAWIEALAQGRLGRMGWVRSAYGRTWLYREIGRFLDEAPARIALIAPHADAVVSLAPPVTATLWRISDRSALDEHLRALANRLREAVATIELGAVAAARLADRVLEARLHGALPIIVPSDAAPFDPRSISGGALVVAFGSAFPDSALPLWAPPSPSPSPSPSPRPARPHHLTRAIARSR